MNKNIFSGRLICSLFILFSFPFLYGQGVVFQWDLSPAEGLTLPQEDPYRKEICLNGYWDIQPVPVPEGWQSGRGIAPDLPAPVADRWESVKIKVPSPVNVNTWGGGQDTGEGTDAPYAPGSVYYPGYPENWIHVRMVWLKKNVTIPAGWREKRLILHFEAVAGECVVLVNGTEVTRNFDSHLPFEADITAHVKKEGENEILVGVRHSKLFDKKHPDYPYFGAVYPSGSNTDDLIGIWQDVFLFAVPDLRITDVFVKPWVDRNELEVEVQLVNQSPEKKKVRVSGEIKEWINKTATHSPVSAAEIAWKLGETAMTLSYPAVEIKPGETKTITITKTVENELKKWTPETPELYTLLLDVQDNRKKYDCKGTRFGWRQFSIVEGDFHLNGKKIQCFGDIQHPFGPYICSRRFAWAWYKMIKDFGGNAVRPHAQPWPKVYYDLADEMGLMVLDETALFGSSIRLNLEEDITWERSEEHLKRLIFRDRNHPSVIGWSAGNEMFAIALLNKPEKEVANKWDDKLVELTLSAIQWDPTREFITLDGDRDMDGRLPVWSKHFAHGLKLEDLPENLNKPLIVGESGATYYGRPGQLYPFVGEKAFESYYGRSEALAIDVYQNAVYMARPYLAYFSPSEVCWFGIEHMNLGYHDYSRLPGLQDGIFPGKPYEEGKPGYQFERIPPYVTTFNPGLDSRLPLYKLLPMFEALQAALSGPEPNPSPWDTWKEVVRPERPAFPEPVYRKAGFAGDRNGKLYAQLQKLGLQLTENMKETGLMIIDAASVNPGTCMQLKEAFSAPGKTKKTIWLMIPDGTIDPEVLQLLPVELTLTDREATALEYNARTEWGRYFDLPALYFAETDGDKKIQKAGLSGPLVENGEVVLTASRTDWSLFNNVGENRKCAQVVLYEHLQKPGGAALVTSYEGNTCWVVSSLDYRLDTKETFDFWRTLLPTMGIEVNPDAVFVKEEEKRGHDLLLDGPVD